MEVNTNKPPETGENAPLEDTLPFASNEAQKAAKKIDEKIQNILRSEKPTKEQEAFLRHMVSVY